MAATPPPMKRKYTYKVYDKPTGPQHIESQPQAEPEYLGADDSLVKAEDEDKVTPYLIFLILAAALAGFLFGYDTGVVGSALPLVGTDLGHTLSSSEEEIITAGTTIGAIFGSSILGALADRFGRKPCLFVADVCFTIGAVIIASSYSVPQIIVGRIVLGVGVGGASVIAPLYITELAPTAVRGRCLGTNAFFIPFGQVVSSAIGAGLQTTKGGWRILFALGVIPSMIQLALMHWLPESPRVMILRGKDEDAKRTLQRIYQKASPEIIDLKLRIATSYVEATTQMQRSLTFYGRIKRVVRHGPYRRAIITVAGMQMFTQLSGFNTLLYYSGTLFGLFGFTNGAAAGLVPSGINALFVLIGMSIVDRVGRRRLALVGFPIMVTGLIWAAVVVWYMTAPTDHLLVDGADYNRALAGALIGGIAWFCMGYGIGYSHLGWYQAEYLALEIRAIGSAIATTWVWLANLTVSVSYLTELQTLTPTGTYGLYLGFVLCGWVFVYFCYPESMGIPTDEMNQLYEHGFGIQKSVEMRAEKAAARRRLHDPEATKTAPGLDTPSTDNGTNGLVAREK